MNSNQNIPNEPGTGFLVVKVFTGNGAIPLSGATVTVRNNEPNSEESGNVITTLFTDRSGNTEKIALPAPSRLLSQSPGNLLPFSTYNIEVFLDRYQSATFQSVPIFDSILSIQPVELIPRTENGTTDNFDPYDQSFFESQSPEL